MSFSSPRLPPSLVCRDRHTKPSNKVGNKEGALTQILIRSSPCCWLGCFFPTTDPWDECVFTVNTYIWVSMPYMDPMAFVFFLEETLVVDKVYPGVIFCDAC